MTDFTTKQLHDQKILVLKRLDEIESRGCEGTCEYFALAERLDDLDDQLTARNAPMFPAGFISDEVPF